MRWYGVKGVQAVNHVLHGILGESGAHGPGKFFLLLDVIWWNLGLF